MKCVSAPRPINCNGDAARAYSVNCVNNAIIKIKNLSYVCSFFLTFYCCVLPLMVKKITEKMKGSLA